MAKLSAHGYEVARVKFADDLGTDTQYEVTLSFRSDGQIMRKLKALNIHNSAYGGSPHHDYGWKLWKKLKDPKRDTVGRQKNLAVKTVKALPQDSIIDTTI